ncbi:hypothetical protein [Streptomyces griseus]|uniref:hypothetical protein n=1 Tax=Streptomyces griseus TaxID=1911 RepID=UPI001F346521|nr:hypothetical protein [Streptomyces griseus]
MGACEEQIRAGTVPVPAASRSSSWARASNWAAYQAWTPNAAAVQPVEPQARASSWTAA